MDATPPPIVELAEPSDDSSELPLLADARDPAKKKQKKKTKDKAASVADDNAPRGNQPSLAIGGIVGTNGLGPLFGAEGWYLLSRSINLGVVVTSSSAENKASGDIAEDVTVNVLDAGVWARFFIGKSFYIAPALSFLSINGNYGVVITDQTSGNETSLTTPYKATMLAAQLNIGNQWSFDSGFYFGCDWIGGIVPLSLSVTTDEADADDVLKAIKKTVQVEALKIDVGWRF